MNKNNKYKNAIDALKNSNAKVKLHEESIPLTIYDLYIPEIDALQELLKKYEKLNEKEIEKQMSLDSNKEALCVAFQPYVCPICHGTVNRSNYYCPHCGQRLKF